MKKTKHIELILITALCSSFQARGQDWQGGTGHTYIRSDSTAPYTRAHGYGSNRPSFYAFRPYGNFYHGRYVRAGYYSEGIHESSNIGHNSFKSSVTRGGFGKGAFSVSS